MRISQGETLGPGPTHSLSAPEGRHLTPRSAPGNAKKHVEFVQKPCKISQFAAEWPLSNPTFCIRTSPCNPAFSRIRPLFRRLSHSSSTVFRISVPLQP